MTPLRRSALRQLLRPDEIKRLTAGDEGGGGALLGKHHKTLLSWVGFRYADAVAKGKLPGEISNQVTKDKPNNRGVASLAFWLRERYSTAPLHTTAVAEFETAPLMVGASPRLALIFVQTTPQNTNTNTNT